MEIRGTKGVLATVGAMKDKSTRSVEYHKRRRGIPIHVVKPTTLPPYARQVECPDARHVVILLLWTANEPAILTCSRRHACELPINDVGNGGFRAIRHQLVVSGHCGPHRPANLRFILPG
jgi:hypothetical protein